MLIKNHRRKWLAGPYAVDFDGESSVACICNGKEIPAQVDANKKKLVMILPDIDEGKTLDIEIKKQKDTSFFPSVKCIENPEKSVVDIMIGEEYFSSFHYGKDVVRPYLNPLC